MPKRIVTLGEILLRLSPPDHQSMKQAKELEMNFGGSEANVALALCNFGMEGVVVSKVPDNALGQSAINHFRRYGVNTDYILKGGNRLGLYFLESGTWARPSKVIYDRAQSSMSLAKRDEFDFDKILEDADWFHTSGITTAISEESAEIALQAMKTAKAKGITTSFDINFRQKIWSAEKARPWLTKLCEQADVYIGNTGHASLLLDVDCSDTRNYENVFSALYDRFGFKYIACTSRKVQSASQNEISALVSDGKKSYRSKEYSVSIIDRVGSGDAFAAGLIYGLLDGRPLENAAAFGIASCALKHTYPGDATYSTVEEVKALVAGNSSAHVQR